MDQQNEICQRRLGTTVRGKWTLEKLLGAGGMAAVYVGVHKIGRRVVENDNLSSLTQGPFEIAFEVESKIVELTRRCRPKKEANIDVAAG